MCEVRGGGGDVGVCVCECEGRRERERETVGEWICVLSICGETRRHCKIKVSKRSSKKIKINRQADQRNKQQEHRRAS